MKQYLEIIKLRALRLFACLCFPKYQLTWPDLAWYDDTLLNEGLEKFGETRAFNAHRRMFLRQAARLIYHVPGDTAECGVYKGLGSWLIWQTAGRPHYGFDSFEGLSTPRHEDGEYWKMHDLRSPLATAQQLLADCKDVTLYPGWIPVRFHEVMLKRFALVHIDVDLYAPTLESLRFFYPRLNAGGILICDDYGSGRCPGATKACDEFFYTKQERMIFLPGGGGFLIKGSMV